MIRAVERGSLVPKSSKLGKGWDGEEHSQPALPVVHFRGTNASHINRPNAMPLGIVDSLENAGINERAVSDVLAVEITTDPRTICEWRHILVGDRSRRSQDGGRERSS